MKVIKSAGRLWMKFAEAFGTFQMIVFLSLIYWTMFAIVALPFRLRSDSLKLRREDSGIWVQRSREDNPFDSMKRQG